MYNKIYKMVEYSFDLSYYLDDNINDRDIQKIIKKYPSCKWYASDTGPFGNNKVRVCRNNGYNTKNFDELKKLIKEISKTPGIFFDFVSIYYGGPDDGTRIYCSPNCLERMVEPYKSEYLERIQCLTGNELKIFSSLTKKIK